MTVDQGTNPVRTTCPYCGVGCGVLASPGEVAGDQQHPANGGRLCVKGSTLNETLVPGGRLLSPQIDGLDVDWPAAIDAVSGAIRQAVAEHGPSSVGFYLSGQLLTEDYYVANKLAKGFVGTPHVDTNSRLCMSSAVAAHKRAFGEDCVPGCYQDLELADLVVLTGSNAAWAHPVLYQRIKAAQRPGRRIVVIDPRQTATTELADLHLALRPGTDAILFNGLLVWLADHQALDRAYLAEHCTGFDEALACARASAPDPATVARHCDLSAVEVERFYRWFADTPRTVTAFSQGINQSEAGTDKGNAIINCHLATGRVGRPGASPFSLTGQPNAMGGREVGGLANTLAAHMDYDSPGARERVAQFWNAPALATGPGHKAVDLFEAVHRGEIRVLWIMGTNPAVSLPQPRRVREALARCPTVIVSDCVAHTDTAEFARIRLSAAGWGEKDGTVTNSERRISRQRGFLPLPGQARPDWWILSAVGRALGHDEAFGYQHPVEIFREHAALSGLGNDGARVFDIQPLAGLSREDYDRLEPIQWPVRQQAGGGWQGTARLFANGGFPTPDRRARCLPVEPRPAAQQPSAAFPLVVNTGRIRDQWHTMTRTALAPRLLAHRPEPYIEVHPVDARRLGLTEGDLGRLLGATGDPFTGRIRVTRSQRPGEVFVPIHWNRQFSPQALASDLIQPLTDPLSGQPESKHGAARLMKLPVRWQARLMRRNDPGRALVLPGEYQARTPLTQAQSWWLAGFQSHDWAQRVEDLLGGPPQLVMVDVSDGRFRAARLVQGRLEGVLLVEANPALLPDLGWLDRCFAQTALGDAERRSLLAGRAVDAEDTGTLICTCFQVGDKQIARAIAGGCRSVEALGSQLRCGTNCGSCVPELRALLSTQVADEAGVAS